MRVVITGATGMIGGGVLRECLEDERVDAVLSLGRRTCGITDPKLAELVAPNLFELGHLRDKLVGYDACFYCLGVSSAGMNEADYTRVTYDLTLAIIGVLSEANPNLVVCFVSGQGSDSTESGRSMWARVKGKTENALLAMDFATYVFRPGVIQPLKGIQSRTRVYRVLYRIMTPIFPILRRFFPGSVTTTVTVGQAMIRVASDGDTRSILETADVNQLGATHA